MTHAAKSSRSPFALCFALLLVGFALLLSPSSQAQTSCDQVTVNPTVVARVGIAMEITAGPNGAPGGFTVCWMTYEDFVANNSDWHYADLMGADMDGSFTGAPTKHTFGGISSFVLGPNETVTIEIGDLFDETGVTTDCTNELQPGATYVMTAYANASGEQTRSEYSATSTRTTNIADDCLFTQGYWKNHPSAWPVTTLTLGTVSYTQAELLSILNTPAQGNGLIFLAHQLIATKLNIAGGASGATIASTVAAADALIGSLVIPPIGSGYLTPASASALTNMMDDYNNGQLGPVICNNVSTQSASWGAIKELYK